MAFVPLTVTTAQLSSSAWAALRRRQRNSDGNECSGGGFWQIHADLSFGEGSNGLKMSRSVEIGQHCGCET